MNVFICRNSIKQFRHFPVGKHMQVNKYYYNLQKHAIHEHTYLFVDQTLLIITKYIQLISKYTKMYVINILNL